MNSFRVLNQSLKILNYSSYQEYLKSPIWQKIRRRELARKGAKCQACGAVRNLNVHHTRYGYKTLTGESKKGFYVLCQNCHHGIHAIKEKDLKSDTKKYIGLFTSHLSM